MPVDTPPGSDPQPEARPATEARFTPAMEASLLRARPWILFLGIMGFIAAGIAVLFGLGSIVLGLGGGALSGRSQPMILVLLGALYSGTGAVWIYPALSLVRGASRAAGLITAYDADDREDAAENALRELQNYFRFNGILAAIGLVLYGLAVIGTCGLSQPASQIFFQF